MVVARQYIDQDGREIVCVSQDAARKNRRPRRLNPMLGIGIMALIVLGLTLAYVAQQASLTSLSYELQATVKAFQTQQVTNDFLRYQVAQKRSLQRIETAARQRLGMTQPANVQVVVVEDEPAAQMAKIPIGGAEGAQGRVNIVEVALNWLVERLPNVGSVEAGRIRD